MIVGVPAELNLDERRVALVPALVPTLSKRGLELVLERGVGAAAGFPDSAYEEQGARMMTSRAEVISSADIILQVHPLGGRGEGKDAASAGYREKQVVLGLLNPFGSLDALRQLADSHVTAFALELLPRISRAQPMDALTSMATVAGYKAVLLAAEALTKMFPMMITAAGTITPARVLIVGAGVAGLQAIATSRRLGAVVYAYDVRPAVKEQVESLGAKFLELPVEAGEAEAAGGYAKELGDEFYRRQRELMAGAVAESDVVITTAAIPGAKAPVLITEEMVHRMRSGAVIVDLAAEGGGNCELTRAGETVSASGVAILGPVDLAASVPHDASQMYAKNVAAFLANLVEEGAVKLDLDDEILRETLVTHGGEVTSARVREHLGLPPLPAKERSS